MDKPITMSVKDYLMRVQSVRTNTPLKAIEAVIEDQFAQASEAIQSPYIYSVEISGFGKLTFNMKKAVKKYEKHISKRDMWTERLKDTTITDALRKSYSLKLENTIKWLQYIAPKLNINYEQADGICSPNTQGTPKCGEDIGGISQGDEVQNPTRP